MIEGGCLCGRIRFQIAGAPECVAHCHCASCRKHSGSAIATFAIFRTDRVVWHGERARYGSSPGVTRSFCPHCGSPLAYENARRAGDIDIYLGALDRPEDFPATLHVHERERLPWLDMLDHCPCWPTTPDPSPPP